MLRFLTTLLILLAMARLLSAEPLDARQLPANAAWVVHLDVEAAKASVLAQAVRDNWMNQPEIRKAIQKARNATGMDPTREIRSLTLYGLDYSPEQTVLIVRGKVDRPRLEALLQKIPGYRHEVVDGHELHFWTEEQNHARAGISNSRAGAFFRDDTIVISADTKTLIVALNVLEEKVSSLSATSPLALVANEGTFVQAAAVGFADAKNLPIQSPILRQCESGSIALGEHQGTVFFHGKLITRSAESAAQVKSAFDAWRGISMRKMADDIQRLLLRPLNVDENDKTIEIDWAQSSKELVKLIQARQLHSIAKE